jgi:hypothetical protein
MESFGEDPKFFELRVGGEPLRCATHAVPYPVSKGFNIIGS